MQKEFNPERNAGWEEYRGSIPVEQFAKPRLAFLVLVRIRVVTVRVVAIGSGTVFASIVAIARLLILSSRCRSRFAIVGFRKLWQWRIETRRRSRFGAGSGIERSMIF